MILEMIPDQYYSQLFDELKIWRKKAKKQAKVKQIKSYNQDSTKKQL